MIPNTQAYRRLWLTNAMPPANWSNTVDVYGELLRRGEVREVPVHKLGDNFTLEMGLDNLWTLTFRIEDRYREFMSGPDWKGGVGMFGLGVAFEGGYQKYENQNWKSKVLPKEDTATNMSFKGIVTSLQPQFEANGLVWLTGQAQSQAFSLVQSYPRGLQYPAGTRNLDNPKVREEVQLYELYGRKWALTDTLTLKQIVEGIALSHGITKIKVDSVYDRITYSEDPDDKNDNDFGPYTQGSVNNAWQNDWQCLSTLAKRHNATFWYSGGAIYFLNMDDRLEDRSSELTFVYNTPFGDGNRKHFVSPEEVDLEDPKILPMMDIQISGVNLLQAPPFARGRFQFDAQGNAYMQAHTPEKGAGFGLDGLNYEKIVDHASRSLGGERGFAFTDALGDGTFWQPGKSIGPTAFANMVKEGLISRFMGRHGGAFQKGESRPRYYRWPFKIKFNTLGTSAVYPGMMVDVSNLCGWLDGYWMVTKITHVFGRDLSWNTSLTVEYGPFAENMKDVQRIIDQVDLNYWADWYQPISPEFEDWQSNADLFDLSIKKKIPGLE